MDNFREIAERIISGELSGTLIHKSGGGTNSKYLKRHNVSPYFVLTNHPSLHIEDIVVNQYGVTCNSTSLKAESSYADVVGFIPAEPKAVKIQVPEGYEIDKEKSTFENIVFKKKDSKPLTWDEYCKQTKRKDVVYINDFGDVDSIVPEYRNETLRYYDDRNTLPSEEIAHKFLTYMQLVSLQQAWVKDWKPSVNDLRYSIVVDFTGAITVIHGYDTRSLSFPDYTTATEFLEYFKYLLEQAKGLY